MKNVGVELPRAVVGIDSEQPKCDAKTQMPVALIATTVMQRLKCDPTYCQV